VTIEYTATTILGVMPEEGGRIQLWMLPEAKVQVVGTFTPGSALGMAMRLIRKHPDLQIFEAHPAAAVFADLIGSMR
jgi:cysteine synthase